MVFTRMGLGWTGLLVQMGDDIRHARLVSYLLVHIWASSGGDTGSRTDWIRSEQCAAWISSMAHTPYGVRLCSDT